jgi:predicted nucleic acid-binding protein
MIGYSVDQQRLAAEIPHDPCRVGEPFAPPGFFERRWPVRVIDGLLAATAIHYDLTVVSRNSGDFASVQVPVVNPWTE